MTKEMRARSRKLVAAFERRLGDDRAELIASRDTACDASGVECVRFIAHRIVGSARLFGCDDLEEPAGKVEELVDAGADPGAIVQAVNHLAERIEEALSDGLPLPDWSNPRA
jgi:HPt (histidine-containing phosphotransfer) domain-containing protein